MGFGVIVNPGSSPFSAGQFRRQFLSNLLTITGDTRVLWMPQATDTTTSLDETRYPHTFTADASMTLVAQGSGYSRAFNGSSQYLTTPDVAELTFGNGTVDSAFSIVAVANVTNTAAARTIISKNNTSQGEWYFQVQADDTLLFTLADQSVPAVTFRASNSAITQGSWGMLGGSYDGTGGATAANGIALYQNGISIASTATNSASYVAMEDKTAPIEIGSITAHTASFFQGSLAMVAVCQKNLSASDHWAIWQLCRGYFNL